MLVCVFFLFWGRSWFWGFFCCVFLGLGFWVLWFRFWLIVICDAGLAVGICWDFGGFVGWGFLVVGLVCVVLGLVCCLCCGLFGVFGCLCVFGRVVRLVESLLFVLILFRVFLPLFFCCCLWYVVGLFGCGFVCFVGEVLFLSGVGFVFVVGVCCVLFFFGVVWGGGVGGVLAGFFWSYGVVWG